MAEQLAKGVYPIKDRWGIFRSPSPLFPLILAPLTLVFKTISIGKLLVTFFAMLLVLMVYLIGKRISVETGITSALSLLALHGIMTLALAVYVDVPLAFFSALSLYLILKVRDDKTMKSAILLGIVLALSTIIKSDGWFLTAFLSMYLLYNYFSEEKKEPYKLFLVSIAIFSVFFALLLIRDMIVFGFLRSMAGSEYFLPDMETIKRKTMPHPFWSYMEKTLSPNVNYIEAFGVLNVLFLAIGMVYGLKTKNRVVIISLFMLLPFLILFIINGGESRYLSLIFPEVALISGIFLADISKLHKYLFYVIVVMLLFAAWQPTNLGILGSIYERWSPNFLNALYWLRNNTPENSSVWAVYCGSVKYFADRACYFLITPEFPFVMESQNSTYVYDVLKGKYNFDYVLIWNGVVGEEYYYPKQNLVGVMNLNVINLMLNDTRFEKVYENQETMVLKIK